MPAASATPAPLIVTLKLDDSTLAWANQFRQQYFPPERNFLSAHVTLFHALPGDQLAAIQAQLTQRCAQTSRLPVHYPTLRFLGQGVAIALECPALVELRQALAATWKDWLTPQDRQAFRPHITIQNKVSPDIARHTYAELLSTWQPVDGYGEGLVLWSYQGGPWERLQEFWFTND